jgi:thiosulfate dehydrogenase [quinone] large subunit
MANDSVARTSSLQQVALVSLRTLIGWHFLYEGLYKLRLPAWSPDGTPIPAFSAAGYLKAATGPIGKLAQSVVTAGGLPIIDKLVMFGVAAVGFSLILGFITRAGCIGALALLAMFYLTMIPTTGMPAPGNEGNYLFVNKTLIEAVAVLVLLAFDTGRIAGLDRLWHDRRQASRLASVPSQDRLAVGQGSGK